MNPRHIWQPYCSLAACQPERFTPDARVSFVLYLCAGESLDIRKHEWQCACDCLLRELPDEINNRNGWKDNCIEINNRTVGECKQLFYISYGLYSAQV